MACSFRCLQTYQVPPPSIGDRTSGGPEPEAVAAPYAIISLIQGGGANMSAGTGSLASSSFVTVGNESAPAVHNTAVLASLQVSVSGAVETVAEVIDEEGGEFTEFASMVYSDITNGQFSMLADFGWIRKSCSTGAVQPYYLSMLPQPFGGYIYGVIHDMEIQYTAGRVKFTIKTKHPFEASASYRVNFPFGSEDQRMRLVPAINSLHSRSNPPVQRVVFSRMTNGQSQPFSFRNSEGGRNGPYSAWAANQQQPLAAARNWLNSLTTDRNKGIYTILNSMDPQPTVTFREDPTPACNENPQMGQYWGTYIVNGGDCTPVISFEPKTNYMFAMNLNPGNVTGGPGGLAQRMLTTRLPAQQQQQRQTADCRPVRSRTATPASGIQTFIAPPQSDINWRPPALVAERLQQSIDAHLATQRNTNALYKPINAELKIQGDPRYTNNDFVNASWRIGIIVVNPFRVVRGNENCDWLANPPCNNIFSSDKWKVMGADHQIAKGSYTTTIKVFLDQVGQ